MRIAVIGGAGFIGCHACQVFAEEGHDVVIFDNYSRRGSEANGHWLRETYGLAEVRGDIRQPEDLGRLWRACGPFDVVLHLAAQVAVTTSVTDPRTDFEINALGTFNVLEACRAQSPPPIVLYASTNKVYGGMEDVAVVEQPDSYAYRDFPQGIGEDHGLDFHSPYGCSKGCGDQYVRDYWRIYGVPTVVMRQSCIYGPRQFGVEDQGWIAWFAIAALFDRPITIYGDGKQVRDVLYVADLIEAYRLAILHIDRTQGNVYNIGGGPRNTLSVWAGFGPLLEKELGRSLPVRYEHWRPGDQRVYVSDTRRFEQTVGWAPRVGIAEGVHRLMEWIRASRDLVASALGLPV